MGVTTTSRTPRFHTHILTTSALTRAAFVSLAFSLGMVSNAQAVGVGEQVVSGTVNFVRPTNNDLIINQGSDRAIINWQNFDILSGQSATFNQPSANAIALNRITDGNATQIFGQLSANGRIVIVNTSGVVFQPGSQVNVASLVASSADINNSDFNAGKLNFSIAGKPQASVVNKGSITAAQGGLVALVAPSVRNDGLIQANLGTVALAGAQTASIDMYGDNLYSFKLGEKTTAEARDENGNRVNSAVENNGAVFAQGGTIVLTANAAKDIVTNAVNNTGVLEASSAEVVGGTVILGGGEGHVRVAGSVRAKGKTGGDVTVTGSSIALASADIDASGTNGGGRVRIGGDYQGQGDLQRADSVNFDRDSVVNVSATDRGDGGTAVVWSDGATQFDGRIEARGGVAGGNGGNVETSGKYLAVNGAVDATAPKGNSGNWLLDPLNIVIGTANQNQSGGVVISPTGIPSTVNAASILSALNSGTNVRVTTVGTVGPDAGNISVLANLVWAGAGSLVLEAVNDILTFARIQSGGGNVTLTAGNNIVLSGNLTFTTGNGINNSSNAGPSNAGIITGPGSVTLNARDVTLNNARIQTSSGNITINNTGVFSSTAADVLSVGGGARISLNQSSAGSVQNAIDAVQFTGINGATINLGAGVFDRGFVINQDRIFINGAGRGVTIIRPSVLTAPAVVNGVPFNAQSFTPLVLAQTTGSANDIRVSNLTIDGSLVANGSTSGLTYNNASGTVTNVNILNGGSFGFYAVADSTKGHGFRTVNATNIDSGGNSYAAAAVIGDRLIFNSLNSGYDGTSGVVGLDLSNGSRGTVTGGSVTAGSQSGISFHGGNNYVISGTKVTGNGTNDGITDDGIAVGVAAARNITLRNLTVGDVRNGIVANGGSNWFVDGGSFTGSGNGIAFNALTGVNRIVGASISNFANAVLVNNTASAAVTGNTITNGGNGIAVSGSNGATISGNTLTGGTGTGIALTTSAGSTVSGNSVTGGLLGYLLGDTTGTQFTSNTASASTNGVGIAGGSSITATGNQLLANTTNGLIADGVSSLILSSNLFSGSDVGLLAIDTTGLTSTGDQYTGNATGARLIGSDAATISGATFTNNALGIDLDGSASTQIADTTLTNPAGGTGLRVLSTLIGEGEAFGSGPSSATLSNVSFTGGATSVLLDGPESSLAFAGNGNVFSNVGSYFILQNGAMNGLVLDASQQTFDGTRAADFTPIQLAAAEGITTDVEDGVGVGDVFYTRFPVVVPPPPNPEPTPEVSVDPDLGGVDESQRNRRGLLRRGLFSYAGRTLTNDGVVTNSTFQVADLNLSLLNAAGAASASTAPVSATSIANRFATLAPAAGGANPQALANLSPSAGGNTAFSPVVGALSATTANSFLGEGYKVGFTPITGLTQ